MAKVNSVNNSLDGQTGNGSFAGSDSPQFTTQLGIDNLNLSGNTLSSDTANDININPANGQDVNLNFTGASRFVIDGTTGINAIINDSTLATASSSNVCVASALKTYIDALGGRLANIQFYTTSTTWSKPAYFNDDSFVIALCQAGGGGSGGVPATGAGEVALSGAGAGGGFCLKRILGSALGATETVNVGGGGAGGSAGSNPGNTGGQTYFGTHLTANGGNGGQAGVLFTGTVRGVTSATGGTATGGDINVRGGYSPPYIITSNSIQEYSLSRIGGSSFLGCPGSNVGNLYGGGGGARSNAPSSGAAAGYLGGNGVCIVFEYY